MQKTRIIQDISSKMVLSYETFLRVCKPLSGHSLHETQIPSGLSCARHGCEIIIHLAGRTVNPNIGLFALILEANQNRLAFQQSSTLAKSMRADLASSMLNQLLMTCLAILGWWWRSSVKW